MHERNGSIGVRLRVVFTGGFRSVGKGALWGELRGGLKIGTRVKELLSLTCYYSCCLAGSAPSAQGSRGASRYKTGMREDYIRTRICAIMFGLKYWMFP